MPEIRGLYKATGASSGDTAKAHTAYQDFLALWKDADPDIPILRQAKAEYEKLKQAAEVRSLATFVETAAIVFLLAGILIELAIFAMQVKATLKRIETKLDAIGKR